MFANIKICPPCICIETVIRVVWTFAGLTYLHIPPNHNASPNFSKSVQTLVDIYFELNLIN